MTVFWAREKLRKISSQKTGQVWGKNNIYIYVYLLMEKGNYFCSLDVTVVVVVLVLVITVTTDELTEGKSVWKTDCRIQLPPFAHIRT